MGTRGAGKIRVVVGIPARMGATRFPGKPLKPILGLPMIQHVHARARMANGIDSVFVATCDEEIRRVVEGFGGVAIMTDPGIPRPGLRVAEACRSMELDARDIVVVVQGDEPLVHPDMITVAVNALVDNPTARFGTLVDDATEEEWLDPDEVKVVANMRDEILYMTRSPVPSFTQGRFHRRLKQVAIMPFRFDFLMEFQSWDQTPLELDESVELCRGLDRGVLPIAIPSPHRSVSVDTAEGLAEAEMLMRDDPIFSMYA